MPAQRVGANCSLAIRIVSRRDLTCFLRFAVEASGCFSFSPRHVKMPTLFNAAGLPTVPSRTDSSLSNHENNRRTHRLLLCHGVPHFMGYRFGLFNFATKSAGGSADFDWFHIGDRLSPK